MAIGLVLLHALIVVPHGYSHTVLQINMNTWQNLYILLVINLLPLVSAVMIWRRSRLGYLLLLISMFGALVFGCYYHFVAAGPDNVGSVGTHPWSSTFQLTAVLLAVVELAGAITGFLGYQRYE
jgi:hypothetical protein